MISKELLTNLSSLLAVMLKLTDLIVVGLESLRINRGILILVGVNYVNCLISFTPS